MRYEEAKSLAESLGHCFKEVEIDLTLYPLDAVYRALYYMTESAYILLVDTKSENSIKVLFIAKNKNEKLENIILEFFNKILIAKEELRSMKDSEDVRKLLASGVVMDIKGYASSGGQKC